MNHAGDLSFSDALPRYDFLALLLLLGPARMTGSLFPFTVSLCITIVDLPRRPGPLSSIISACLLLVNETVRLQTSSC